MKVTIEIPAYLAKHIDSYRLFDSLQEWIQDADVIEEAASDAAEVAMVSDEDHDRYLDDDEREEFSEALAEEIREAMSRGLCVSEEADQAAA